MGDLGDGGAPSRVRAQRVTNYCIGAPAPQAGAGVIGVGRWGRALAARGRAASLLLAGADPGVRNDCQDRRRARPASSRQAFFQRPRHSGRGLGWLGVGCRCARMPCGSGEWRSPVLALSPEAHPENHQKQRRRSAIAQRRQGNSGYPPNPR